MATTPDHYRYERDGIEMSKDLWVDWYHEMIFEADGKHYSLLIAILLTGKYPVPYVTFTEGPLKLVDKVNESLSKLESAARTPFTHYQEIQPGNIELEHFFSKGGAISRRQFDDIRFEDDGADGLIVGLDGDHGGVEFHYKANGEKVVKADSKPLKCELVCKPKCPQFWWGNKEEYDAPWAQEMTIRGTEELCRVDGVINYEGQDIEVEDGKALVEHVYIKKMDWLEWRWMDWCWFHTDELLGLISRYEMKGDYHWEWGTLYFPDADVQVHCNSCEFRNTKLAWSPEHMRFIPIEQTAVAKTDEGILELELVGIKKPIKRTGKFDPDYITNGIQGWAFTFWTIAYEVRGRFTYNDGRVLELTPGVGMQEPQAVSPIT